MAGCHLVLRVMAAIRPSASRTVGPRPENLLSVTCMKAVPDNLWGEKAISQLVERQIAFPNANRSPFTDDDVLATVILGNIAARSGIFAIDRDAICDAANSIRQSSDFELPPCPFQSVVIDSDSENAWDLFDDSPQDKHLKIKVFAVIEVEEGVTWDVGFLLSSSITGHAIWVAGLILEGGRIFEIDTIDQGKMRFVVNDEVGGSALARLVIEAIHLITARGISLSPIAESRQSRRARERRGVTMPPHLYWVTVDDTLINSKPGRGEKEFRYRWLVRGHWRHFTDERKTWVRAYIKGKPGAPWKGRPVYRVPT